MDFLEEGSFSPRPHYAIRDSYFNGVKLAGGVPMGIPFQADLIDDYLDQVDGLLVPGGDFAFPLEWYKEQGEKSPFPPSPRLEFDIAITKKALERDMPILGICAGMQILAGVMGGKLTANIDEHSKSLGVADVTHRGTTPLEFAHKLLVEDGTLLEEIVGMNEMGVNSHHSEGVVEAPEGLIVSGKAEDGVIEVIEVADKEFAIGVQFHPEFFLKEGEPNFEFFKNLVKAASNVL